MPTVLRLDSPVMASKPELYSSDKDVFISQSPSSNHHRFSYFNNELFAVDRKTSPNHAKKVLEAHLAETERRIQDASRLGTTLLQQRKDLEGRLDEVEKQQTEENLSPELRLKLVELEKEYNDVGRESARAFLSKSRASGLEIGASSYTGEFKRPISPSKENLECQGIGSPSKINTLNRRQRNQPSNRIHDIEFATEISTSLLSQIRNLQALLAEKEDYLKSITTEKLKLEADFESLAERLRSLDESGERYKDENWSLETQIHELIAKDKEAADRERRLLQSLNILQAEKSAAQKDLDEIKLSYAKLSDDHISAIKQCDVELGNLKRNITTAESEKAALQRKIDELLNQNKELATAIVHHRGRLEGLEQNQGLVEENLDIPPDDLTPEHSPPPSPVKGTPRHAMLESETLKSSLQHAHRMIQNLKSNIQREKAEKLDLKRLLQDARDELEIRRNDLGPTVNRKPRKLESRDTKKHSRIGHLGGLRSSTREVHIEDPNWEDYDSGPMSPSPGTQIFTRSLPHRPSVSNPEQSTPFVDNFRARDSDSYLVSTETETSEAFETAYERFSGEEAHVNQIERGENLTETDDGADRLLSPKAHEQILSPGNRLSFHSTASTSDDDFENCYRGKVTANAIQPSRLRLRVGHCGYRRSRISSIDSQSYASPGSMTNTSRDVTPHEKGKSLFAELGNMCGTDEDEPTLESPSMTRDTSRSATPISRPSNMPDNFQSNPLTIVSSMTDSAMITEPWVANSISKQTQTPCLYHSGSRSQQAADVFILPNHSQVSRTTQTTLEIPMRDASCQWDKEVTSRDNYIFDSRPDSPPVSHDANLHPNFYKSVPNVSQLENFKPSVQSSVVSIPKLGKTHLSLSPVISEEFEPFIPATLQNPILLNNSGNPTPMRPKSLVFSDIQFLETKPLQSYFNQVEPASHPCRTSFEDIEAPRSQIQSLNKGYSTTVKEKITSPLLTFESGQDQITNEIPHIKPLNYQQPLQSSTKILKYFNSNRLQTTDDCSQTSLTGNQIEELFKLKRKLSLSDYDNRFSSSGMSRPIRKRPFQLEEKIESTDQVMSATEISDPGLFNAPLTEFGGTGGFNNSTPSAHLLQAVDRIESQATITEKFVSSFGGDGVKPRPLPSISTCKSNPTCRPLTPNPPIPINTPHNDETTLRLSNSLGAATIPPTTRNLRSRVSSTSSFASEMNNRFQIQNTFGISTGLPTGTDPRMINAITQTMIGEYLWKYTRKTGRGAMSEKRHRRYFWVHPYTKTLYWCDRDPSSAGRAELKAKSVPIEAVRVVTDDNPMPPGLHRKSLIILTPSRAVKFTATTGQLHETWFNSLSYLLMRSGGEKHEVPSEILNESITLDDVAEFHPGLVKNNQAGIVSLSSYHSRTTKNEYIRKNATTRSSKSPRTSAGTMSRFGNYLKPSKEGLMGSVTSRHSKYGHEKMDSLYQSNQLYDSADELREIIEKQDREADKLENVRACCDGTNPFC